LSVKDGSERDHLFLHVLDDPTRGEDERHGRYDENLAAPALWASWVPRFATREQAG